MTKKLGILNLSHTRKIDIFKEAMLSLLACTSVPEYDINLNSHIKKNDRYPKQCALLTLNAIRIWDTKWAKIRNVLLILVKTGAIIISLHALGFIDSNHPTRIGISIFQQMQCVILMYSYT